MFSLRKFIVLSLWFLLSCNFIFLKFFLEMNVSQATEVFVDQDIIKLVKREMARSLTTLEYRNIKVTNVAIINNYAMGSWEATNTLDLSMAGIILMVKEGNQWKLDLSYSGFPHPKVVKEEGTKVPIEILLDLYETLYPNWNVRFFGD